MSRITINRITDAAQIDVGSLTIEQTPDSETTLQINGGETQANFTIPAGAFKVQLKNISPKDGGAAVDADILVGSAADKLIPGVEAKVYEAKRDTTSNELKKIPEIQITTNGANIYFYVER